MTENYGDSQDVQESRRPSATTIQTFGNLVKGYLGSGILGLPFAYSQGGTIASFLLLLLVGLVATHCMYLLVLVKKKIVRDYPDVVTFSDISQHLFGPWGAWLLDAILIFTQFGFCCVYVVFVVQNTSALTCQWGLSQPDYFGEELSCIPSVDPRIWVVPWFAIFVGLSWIRSLKNVAFVTIFADVSILFSIVIIMTASGIQLHSNIQRDAIDVEIGIVPSTVAVMLGTGIYAFEGIGTVLPCETSMKHPESFPKVLFSVMGFSTVNYLLFGLIPYLAFGAQTSDQITFNLQQFATCSLPNAPCLGNPTWEAFSTIVSVLLIFAIMGTFPLQLFVVTDIAEEWLFRKFMALRGRKGFYTNIFRTVLVALACVIAISIPQFGLLMGLIGSLGGATLQFIFPAAFVLKLEWHDLSLFRKVLYIFYLCFGSLAGVMGFIQTIQELAAL